MRIKFTVFGASGFIGRHLVKKLQDEGHEVFSPTRYELEYLCRNDKSDLGHVFYCIGMTANFRKQPFETVDAHVSVLKNILNTCGYQSLTYISSTRLYHDSDDTTEKSAFKISPSEKSDLYNISKLMGESLCLWLGKTVRIVRLSNVYGIHSSESFLNDVLTEAVRNGHVVFKTSENSAKDFISVYDVVDILPKIAINGNHQIYNLASGKNTTNSQIANKLSDLGYTCSFKKNGPKWVFPEIDIARISREFNFHSSCLIDDLDLLTQNLNN